MWYWTKVLFLVLVGAVVVWLGYELITFPSISKLRTENPVTSSMIEYRLSEAQKEGKEPRKYMIWQPIEQISPNLQRAVLAGEDSRFFASCCVTVEAPRLNEGIGGIQSFGS